MKIRKLMMGLAAAFIVAGLQSCTGARPENNDGHNLWLGDITTGVENVKTVILDRYDNALGDEGFRIGFAGTGRENATVYANTKVAAMYGAYHLDRLDKCGMLPTSADAEIVEVPAYRYRLLNHWDNPNGTVERGYAGQSLWKWNELPGTIRPEYEEYARANASLGINGTVLNNVNADARMLTREYLDKVKVLADIFRPYGIKVYLSLNFAAPKHLAGLNTSDPLNKDVIKWWNEKVAEIYSIIPDFGGFLVKANSEGQSGPQDYGRTHADGANMLADALKPYGGIVMWRAFVYASTSPDRAKQAVEEFVPFDGAFRDNVIIQIKNGPVDFQPREPFSPLFGQMEKTNVMAELQITQEYMGHSNHMVYLHPMWKEVLDSDTYQKGKGSTVAAITLGKVHGNNINAIAGVTNIGDSINWCGHHLAQANWYAYGRMVWNPELSSEQILDEWLKQTFTDNKKFLEPMMEIMMASHEASVKYEMPLGLHHCFSHAGHYGPGPWESASRPDWMPPYYHKAAADGIGFDRTVNGSDAVSQYHEPLKSLYNNVEACPENLILWFHHLPWDYKMKSGRTLWDELCYTFQEGIDEARGFIDVWESVEKYVDAHRYRQVHDKLVRQAKDAIWWRDAMMLYFQTFSNMPIPADCTPPQYTIDELRNFRLRLSIYETPALDKLPEYVLE